MAFSFGGSQQLLSCQLLFIDGFFGSEALQAEVVTWALEQATAEQPNRLRVVVRSSYTTIQVCEWLDKQLPVVSLAFFATGGTNPVDRSDYPAAFFEALPAKQIDFRSPTLTAFHLNRAPPPPGAPVPGKLSLLRRTIC